MDTVNQAIGILAKAEAALKELVADALARSSYADVAVVSNLAKAISDLRRSVSDAGAVDSVGGSSYPAYESRRSVQVDGTSSQEEAVRKASVRSRDLEKSLYPRFERHAKRLVKLGWSSKDRRIYEQRAPFEIVQEICEQFAEKAGPKNLLKIETILPVKTSAGDEIPSYQVYLVLKWLQQHGVVERQGKDGYVVTQTDFDVKSLWDKTLAK